MTSGELGGRGQPRNQGQRGVPGHHRNPDGRPHNRRGRARWQRISRSLSHPATTPRRRDRRRRAVAVQHRSAYLTGVALPCRRRFGRRLTKSPHRLQYGWHYRDQVVTTFCPQDVRPAWVEHQTYLAAVGLSLTFVGPALEESSVRGSHAKSSLALRGVGAKWGSGGAARSPCLPGDGRREHECAPVDLVGRPIRPSPSVILA